jgi:hypothetical protein
MPASSFEFFKLSLLFYFVTLPRSPVPLPAGQWKRSAPVSPGRNKSLCNYNRLKQRMIYRGPGFLAVLSVGPSPNPSHPLQSASCLCFSVFLCVADRGYWQERWGRRGWWRSKLITSQESLVLYKSFNTLWSRVRCSGSMIHDQFRASCKTYEDKSDTKTRFFTNDFPWIDTNHSLCIEMLFEFYF